MRRFVARAWRSSAVRYVIVGGLAFLVDFGLLALLHDALGVSLIIATPTAFLISFAFTFVVQRALTFGSDADWRVSAVKYTLLVAFNTVATTAIVAGAAALSWPWEAGKIIAVASTTIWNYFGYRYWIFRPPR
ncbi:GtrA family protein [Microbacterium sp. 10M-3C3]|jgi:putative flippase GtrA|uniref:GtrA family protein n=1 Tax=Microbacterium sp. 10M-3C3 TaxID=2483401 RepID=UPI0013DDDB16|nr:GtrA family protein [Microbacterium sp. 10M-3C3]